MNNKLILLGLALALHGCGGGGDDSGGNTTAPVVDPVVTQPQEPAPENTAELAVPADFDFRTDSDVEISVGSVIPGEGIINIYHDFDYHDQVNDIYYPNYTTRVLSFDPNVTNGLTIQVNRNWSALYVEFVPMSAGIREQYHRIALQSDPLVINLD